MKTFLEVTDDYALIPVDEAGRKYVYNRKVGDKLSCEIIQERNYPFHCKAMALVKVVHDALPEPEPIEYKGKMIDPVRTFNDTRKYLTILSGEYNIVGMPNGKVRAEARSWKFNKMNEEEFGVFYNNLVDACLKALPRTWSNEELERVATEIVNFV